MVIFMFTDCVYCVKKVDFYFHQKKYKSLSKNCKLTVNFIKYRIILL